MLTMIRSAPLPVSGGRVPPRGRLGVRVEARSAAPATRARRRISPPSRRSETCHPELWPSPSETLLLRPTCPSGHSWLRSSVAPLDKGAGVLVCEFPDRFQVRLGRGFVIRFGSGHEHATPFQAGAGQTERGLESFVDDVGGRGSRDPAPAHDEKVADRRSLSYSRKKNSSWMPSGSAKSNMAAVPRSRMSERGTS
jgi:hypothetical protein